MERERPELTVRYGRINTEMVSRWLKLDASDDGPFWALNLMKYRTVADYADGRRDALSGRAADDAYAPNESLDAVGARIVFVADVEETLAGDGTHWDRVAIVLYPSRRKFFEMQQRDDFKAKHVHKDAGMEFTIVMSCLPQQPFDAPPGRRPYVELALTAAPATSDGAVFDVEGVIVGDERRWSQAAFRWLDEAPARATTSPQASPASYVLLLRPSIDRLVRSVAG